MAQNPLPFEIQEQECSEWCWAAVVSSVAAFLNAPQQPQQCEVVDKQCFDPMFNPSPGCCDESNRCIPKDLHCLCNQTSSIGRALDAYGLLAGSVQGQVPTSADFGTIAQQIDRSSLVVVEVVDQSNPNLVHAMVAYGHSGTDDLMIGDPANGGTGHCSYSALINPSPDTSVSTWKLLRFFTTVPPTS